MVKSVSQPARSWGVAVYYNAAPGWMSRPALGAPLAMLRLVCIASRKHDWLAQLRAGGSGPLLRAEGCHGTACFRLPSAFSYT